MVSSACGFYDSVSSGFLSKNDNYSLAIYFEKHYYYIWQYIFLTQQQFGKSKKKSSYNVHVPFTYSVYMYIHYYCLGTGVRASGGAYIFYMSNAKSLEKLRWRLLLCED